MYIKYYLLISSFFIIKLYSNDILTKEFNKDVWPDKMHNTKNIANLLKIPINTKTENKDSISISEFERFYGIPNYRISDSSKVRVNNNNVLFVLENDRHEKYQLKITLVKSYSIAWKDFQDKISTASTFRADTGALYQKSFLDGMFSLITFVPPGLVYVLPYGPYFIEISYYGDKLTQNEYFRRAAMTHEEKLSDFSKHEANIAYIAREINSIIKMETPMPSKESLGINQ